MLTASRSLYSLAILPCLLLLGANDVRAFAYERYEVVVSLRDMRTEGKLSDCRRCDRHLPQFYACDVEVHAVSQLSNGMSQLSNFRGPRDQNWYSGDVISQTYRGFGPMPSMAQVYVDIKDRDIFDRREHMGIMSSTLPIVIGNRQSLRLYGGCGVSIVFSVVARCLNDFIGPRCNCRSGVNYDCNADGTVRCHNGYTGDSCQYRKTTTTTTTTTTRTTTTTKPRDPFLDALATQCRLLRSLPPTRSRMIANCTSLLPIGRQEAEAAAAATAAGAGAGAGAGAAAELGDSSALADASPTDWPFVVPISHVTSRGNRVLRCSGVLISQQFVLASARCFAAGDLQDPDPDPDVDADADASKSKSKSKPKPKPKSGSGSGSNTTTGRKLRLEARFGDPTGSPQYVGVRRIILQSSGAFKIGTPLAQLVLERPVDVAPVCVSTQRNVINDSDLCVSHRWQTSTQRRDSRLELNLKLAKLKLYHKSMCVARYNASYDTGEQKLANNDSVTCSLRSEGDDDAPQCNLHSGSLLCKRQEQDWWTLNGLLYGKEDCDLDLPDVYFDTNAHYDWIFNSMYNFTCSGK